MPSLVTCLFPMLPNRGPLSTRVIMKSHLKTLVRAMSLKHRALFPKRLIKPTMSCHLDIPWVHKLLYGGPARVVIKCFVTRIFIVTKWNEFVISKVLIRLHRATSLRFLMRVFNLMSLPVSNATKNGVLSLVNCSLKKVGPEFIKLLDIEPPTNVTNGFAKSATRNFRTEKISQNRFSPNSHAGEKSARVPPVKKRQILCNQWWKRANSMLQDHLKQCRNDLKSAMFKVNQAKSDCARSTKRSGLFGGLSVVLEPSEKSETWWQCSFCSFKVQNHGSWAKKDSARRYRLKFVHNQSGRRAPSEKGGLMQPGPRHLCFPWCSKT